jgi:small subunit ribosomal protein S6
MAVTLNYYETLYVTRPDLTDDDLVKIQQKLLDSISSNQGEVIRDDKWAERDLAYEIQDHKRGIYYILVFKALPEASKQVEKHLQFYNTDVLRFMTLKITEEAANKNKATQEESTPKTEPAAAPPKAEPTPTASAAEPAAETAAEAASTLEEGGSQ